MARKNSSQKSIDYDKSIKKSNELSRSKLNEGLTLNQRQLFAYAVFATQQDGKTEFKKHQFQEVFDMKQYRTEDAYKDSDKISMIRFSTADLEKKEFRFTNIFSSIHYKNGTFSFKWNTEFIPHILELRDKYVLTDLTITSKFKSGFSWILYDYLKSYYGYWSKDLSKNALMNLFGVEDRVTYVKSTGQFKRGVLDVAVAELNEHTELEVWYNESKIGNKIVGFTLYWSTGKVVAGATDKQIKLLYEIHDEIERNLEDYLSEQIASQTSEHILNIKRILLSIEKGLSHELASEYIQQALETYRQLERLVEINGEKRDTSVYFNWLEDRGD